MPGKWNVIVEETHWMQQHPYTDTRQRKLFVSKHEIVHDQLLNHVFPIFPVLPFKYLMQWWKHLKIVHKSNWSCRFSHGLARLVANCTYISWNETNKQKTEKKHSHQHRANRCGNWNLKQQHESETQTKTFFLVKKNKMCVHRFSQFFIYIIYMRTNNLKIFFSNTKFNTEKNFLNWKRFFRSKAICDWKKINQIPIRKIVWYVKKNLSWWLASNRTLLSSLSVCQKHQIALHFAYERNWKSK